MPVELQLALPETPSLAETTAALLEELSEHILVVVVPVFALGVHTADYSVFGTFRPCNIV